ncbi:MAG TPA: acetyl ornithine aminotransferase family protein [Bryobacteraceae bacterium]|nr:acetyl ornithine aminotransferase family protein [Bryobacteraceae bacterium]
MTPEIAQDLPSISTALPGPRAKAIIERDHAVTSPSYTRGYPLVIERGDGAIITDVDGNRFLDFNAGIAVVAAGHSHPRLIAAIRRQAEKFLHYSGTDFYYENMVQLAEKLAALVPGESRKRVYFGNSGTEGIEAALKLARHATGRQQFVAFHGGFHGRTMGSLSLTASKSIQKKHFAPFVPGVHHLPYANCYRCPYGKTPETCCTECAKAIEDVLIKHIVPADEIAAIFVEPVQGEGGYLVPPPRFLEQIQEIAKRHGILVVYDEVQSGMGRTGKMFAAEHFGTEPDIMVIAKGIASGLPLSAMVASADIMNWSPGMHASTFGGNPVAIEAALTTISLLEEELIENARVLGLHMMSRMRDWPSRFPMVGEVRGLGLMIGIEFVRDQQTKERAPEYRDQVEMLAFERGLLVLGAGPNTLRLCPPLVITKDQADFAVDTLEECLKALTK